MRKLLIVLIICSAAFSSVQAQKFKAVEDTSGVSIDLTDTIFSLPEANIFRFKSKEDEMEYYKTLSRIRKVMPYVQIAKTMHNEIYNVKDNTKKKEYKKYRKDTEKEMREKFEKELRNLSIGQGKALVKLINRETGNNCYNLIKDIKNPISAWGWQIVAKRYGYDLKETYDPKKEWIMEMAIRTLGKEYNIK